MQSQDSENVQHDLRLCGTYTCLLGSCRSSQLVSFSDPQIPSKKGGGSGEYST